MKLIYAFLIFAFLGLFFVIENEYFGWNAFPQSQLEICCDISIIMIYFLGLKFLNSMENDI